MTTLRTTRAITNAVSGRCIAFSAPRRCYAHSSYGGEGEMKAPKNPRTQSIEHPGPPPPDTSSPSSSKPHSHDATTPSSHQEPGSKTKTHHKTAHHGREDSGVAHESAHQSPIPSNKARPTLNDGRQTRNVDEHGNPRQDVPEDVKKHNAEMEKKHDRTYNQLGR